MMYGFGELLGSVAFLSVLIEIVFFIDLVLLGIWLWSQISKK